nr:uncharacterized protein LOC129281678 [Lytechinus pictus]
MLNAHRSKLEKEKNKDSLQDLSFGCLSRGIKRYWPHDDDDLDIDLVAARNAFKLINSKEILLEWIAEVVTNDMCRNIQLEQLNDKDLRFFFILLECPIFHSPQFPWCRKVLTALGKLLISGHGKGNVLSRLERWWVYEPVSFHGIVATYRGAIGMLAENSVLQANEQDNFKTYLKVLQCLHKINIMHDIIDVRTFYLTHLNSNGLEEDLEGFMQHTLRQRISNYVLSVNQLECSYCDAERFQEHRKCQIPFMTRSNQDIFVENC